LVGFDLTPLMDVSFGKTSAPTLPICEFVTELGAKLEGIVALPDQSLDLLLGDQRATEQQSFFVYLLRLSRGDFGAGFFDLPRFLNSRSDA
jgi:hypothetical protein